MTTKRLQGMAATGLVALLVLLGACSHEPKATRQPPLTLPSAPTLAG
jgi:hypothetical protein